MSWHRYLLLFVLCCSSVAHGDDMILAVGASGTDEYKETFAEWSVKWKTAAKEAKINLAKEIGRDDESKSDYTRLNEAISALATVDTDDKSPLWLVMLGHGTYDRSIAKFNLRGKDVEAKELNEWLSKCDRPVIVINGFSCGGAFLQPLQGQNRVIISATKSGSELNFARFGGYLAESMLDMEADLDHDDQVSLLEAFLSATSKVNTFYEEDARLVTEHALLEDNHDGKGISADFFVGIRAQAKAKDGAALDGSKAHRHILKASPEAVVLSPEMAAKRDRIEGQVEKLRSRKSDMGTDEYYEQLEALMVEMAELYRSA